MVPGAVAPAPALGWAQGRGRLVDLRGVVARRMVAVMPATITTIDTHYADLPKLVAAYLLAANDEFAFVETANNASVPRLLAALDQAGGRPEQVRYVIVTHIHLDHAGGAGSLMAACPNATLLAHPRAAPHAIDPTRICAGAREVYGDAWFDALYGEIVPVPATRVQALDDGAQVELGADSLSFLHTRGHANHHFCVHDPAAEAVFTGDAFGLLYPHLQRGTTVALATTTPTDFDAAAAIESIDRIVACGARRLFPTHFGEQRDVAGAAAALREQLEAYGALVDEADASGVEAGELDELCQTRTRALMLGALERAGLSVGAGDLALLDVDMRLNAAGIAFAVRKRRYKRG